ncbi:MAG: hypothetical protein HUU20_13695 [Pirellulales bacterium]|nr:hypothetical protein [Pirellulales bacterium]
MPRFASSIVRVTVLLLVAVAATATLAGGNASLRFQSEMAWSAANSATPQISLGPPGPHRYPAYRGGNYPWYGYGFGVPTYNWGYFGTHYWPSCHAHRGYYGDYIQWSYRRGY